MIAVPGQVEAWWQVGASLKQVGFDSLRGSRWQLPASEGTPALVAVRVGARMAEHG